MTKEQQEALRGYLQEQYNSCGLLSFAKNYGLADEKGNPTPLLTGINDDIKGRL